MRGDGDGHRSAEERAEALMERVTSDAARFVTRFVGRAREEIEDLVAEARSRKQGLEEPSRPASPEVDAPVGTRTPS